MKYLELFEDYYSDTERTKMLNYTALYLETIQPISNNDGFVDCEYSENVKGVSISVSFYFKKWISEEKLDIFYKFLDDNKLKIHNEIDRNLIEIVVKLTEYKIKKYSKLYKIDQTVKNYNL